MALPRSPWLWLGLILLLAAGLRFYRLDSLPPGLFGDEALASLHARNAAASGRFPLYFEQSDGGFHPVNVYLTLLARAVTGSHPRAIRFGVAAAAVLTLPLFFFGLREVFRLDAPAASAARRADSAALLGTLVAAIAFPYVLITRLGFEVFWPAPAGALAFGFLARALRTGRLRDGVWAGAGLGLALYTYYSARLLPVAIALALSWLAFARQRPLRHLAVLVAVVTLAAAVVFAPLAVFFLQHPALFLQRVGDTGSGVLQLRGLALAAQLAENTLRAVGSLSLPGLGDQIARHNLPGRAFFDAFLSLLFWLGLAAALRRWRQASSVLLVAWLAAMLLPVILSLEHDSPHFTRILGAMPALAGLAALGGLTLHAALAAHSRRLSAGLLVLGFAFSLGVTTYDYFGRWAALPALFDHFQTGDWQAAEIAITHSSAERVYLSPDLISDPAHAVFDLRLRGGEVRDFPGPDCLIYRARADRPLRYLVGVLSDPITSERLAARYPAGRFVEPILHIPEPYALYTQFEVPLNALAAPPQFAVQASFGGLLTLTGYDFSAAAIRPGQPFTVTLHWQALQAPLGQFSAFVHFYLPGGETLTPGISPEPVAQNDSGPCAGRFDPARWQVGETVMEFRPLNLPPGFEAEAVAVGLGVYAWPSLARLPLDAPAPLPADRLSLGRLPVIP